MRDEETEQLLVMVNQSYLFLLTVLTITTSFSNVKLSWR